MDGSMPYELVPLTSSLISQKLGRAFLLPGFVEPEHALLHASPRGQYPAVDATANNKRSRHPVTVDGEQRNGHPSSGRAGRSSTVEQPQQQQEHRQQQQQHSEQPRTSQEQHRSTGHGTRQHPNNTNSVLQHSTMELSSGQPSATEAVPPGPSSMYNRSASSMQGSMEQGLQQPMSSQLPHSFSQPGPASSMGLGHHPTSSGGYPGMPPMHPAAAQQQFLAAAYHMQQQMGGPNPMQGMPGFPAGPGGPAGGGQPPPPGMGFPAGYPPYHMLGGFMNPHHPMDFASHMYRQSLMGGAAPPPGMMGMGMQQQLPQQSSEARNGMMMMMDDDDGAGGARAIKRPRLVWTPQLHKRFEEAINKLGETKAVPKNIMQEMNVEGLTRENVASHLQKYRLQQRRDGPDMGPR